jgi:hypothetical protein
MLRIGQFKKDRLLVLAGVLLVSLLLSSFVCAQTSAGRILGSVTDQTGAALSGATVVITDVDRGTSRTLTTDSAGQYAAPDLIAGHYKIRAESKGFRAVERPNVALEVAKDARVDFMLSPGQVEQVVTVTDEVPLVESTNDTLGGTMSNKQINDLPLNGRDFQNLVVLQPGVMRYPGGGYETTSSNGVRPEDNNYIVDGIDNNEPFGAQSVINGTGTGGDSATILPIDAIEQFNVEENPPAEYGWKPGAIVNVGLKSGTNALHGTAYGFERNSAFDARNYFNTQSSGPQTPLRLHQFGATLGGPILKDRLFFFAGYEGVRYLVGNSNQITTPATISLGGDVQNSIPDAISALQGQGIPVSPLSLAVSGCTLGPPVTCSGKLLPLNSTGTNTITSGFPNNARGDNGLLKMDYRISPNHSLSGMFFMGDDLETLQDAPVLQAIWESVGATRAKVIGGTWTWTPTSRIVNEFRIGYNSFRYSSLTADNTVNPTTYGINTGVTNPRDFGMPAILINGFLQEGGNVGWPRYQNPDQSLQFLDNVSITHGKHAFKFGGEARRGWATSIKDRYGKGRIQFKKNAAFAGASPLEDFLAGVPSAGRIFTGDSQRHPSAEWYAAFAQDDWRVNSRLTVNYGLRYELPTVIKEQDDLFGQFDPSIGIVQVGKQISSPYAGNHKNFAPRLGFAWDVTGKGRTVVRAGAGIIYEMIGFNAFLAQLGVNNASTSGINVIPTASSTGVSPGGGNIVAGAVNLPGYALNYTTAGPVFPTNSSTLNCNPNITTLINGVPTPGTPCDILAVNRHLKTPYVSAWNLNIQHSFTNNLVLQIGYVGNEGTKLLSIYDINQNNPALDTAGDEQSGRPFNARFPFLHVINYLSNSYTSNYNGLQSTLTLRNSHGLQFVAGYTWSHAMDYLSDNRGLNAMDGTRPYLEYGPSDFDIRHRFTLTTSYALPGKPGFGQMLQGWQLNSIVTLQTGQPWNVMDTGNDISLTGEGSDRWDFFGSRSDFTSGPTAIPYYSGSSNGACAAKALALDGGNPSGPMSTSLGSFGCYAKGASMMLPPAIGTFGTMSRNMFRDAGFRNWDLSVAKNWKFGERVTTQFRAEFFNVLNHPNFANPAGANVAYGFNDPSAGNFGCGCATPDVAAANPVVGSGGARAIQFGLKIIF